MSSGRALTEIIQEIIADLPKIEGSNEIVAESIPTRHFARIGRHGSDLLLLLPNTDNHQNQNRTLSKLRVNFNVDCQIREGSNTKSETLTILRFVEPNFQLEQTIGDLVALLLDRMVRFDPEQILVVINQLIELFENLRPISESTVLGLWGELFTIFQSTNPTELGRAWHATPRDRFDFSASNWRVEVKTTCGPRQHSFSYEQVHEIKPIRILIASVIASESDLGLNVFDLTHEVLERIHDEEVKNHILGIVIKTVGINKRDDSLKRYDLDFSRFNIKYFEAKNIPQPTTPPIGVFQLQFKSDLQLAIDIPRTEISELGELPSYLG